MNRKKINLIFFVKVNSTNNKNIKSQDNQVTFKISEKNL